MFMNTCKCLIHMWLLKFLLKFYWLEWVCRYLWHFSSDFIVCKDMGIDNVPKRGVTFNLLNCYHKLWHNELCKTTCYFSNRFGSWKSKTKESAGHALFVFGGEYIPISEKWQNSMTCDGRHCLCLHYCLFSIYDSFITTFFL